MNSDRIFYFLPVILMLVVVGGFFLDLSLLEILPVALVVFAIGIGVYYILKARS